MTILAIDIETYSDRDLKKVGVYKYVESPRFNILLFGYAIDDEEVQVIQLARGEEIPRDVLEMLYDPHVIKTAWNAQFERVALSRRLGQQIPAVEWEDTMILAAYHGLPLSLDKAGQALGLEVQKMTATGTKLMNKFSKKGLRPEDDPAGWEKFVEYNRRDVEVERAIRKRLEKYKLPEKEKELWVLDQDINDRGVAVDLQMVREAIRISRAENEKLIGEIQKITGVDNPRSVAQLKKWLEQETEEEIETLDRRQLPKIIESIRDEKIKNALALRLEAAKSSIKKYEAIDRAVCADGRVRGLLQYYGASRTGRWAGRLVQVQNLPRNDMSDLEAAREMLRQGHGDMLGVVWDSTNDVLSQLIRTAFIASEGRRLLIADFSSIEARVLAWLAGEEWKLEVFRTHGKIYEATAAKMFGVPIESIKKGDPLRQRGKVAELALGYQGGVGALIRMGALEMGIEESELPALVRQWRTANPRIVEFWRAIEQAAKNVLDAGGGKEIVAGKIEVSRDRHLPALIIRLPSGRKLYYYRAGLNGDRIEFWNKNNKLEQTYGGKLTENVVQAISRDVLAEAIMRLEKRGYRIVFHVHDEIVAEMPDGEGSVEEMTQIMAEPVPWAPDLPLGAEGVESTFYRKE